MAITMRNSNRKNDQRVLQLVGYHSAYDNDPHLLTGTWGKLKERCSQPDEYPYRSEYSSSQTKLLSFGISFALYPDDPKYRRCEESVTGMRGIILDLEQKEPGKFPSVIQVRRVLSGTEFFGFTTNQHQPGDPRFRVLVPYDRPISKDQHRLVHAYFAEQLPGVLDHCVSSFSQMAFLPYIPDKRIRHFKTFEGKGKFFDPAFILQNADQYRHLVRKPKPATTRKKRQVRAPVTLPPVDIKGLGISKYLRHLIKSGDASSFDGDRSRLVCSVVLGLTRQVRSISDETMAGILLNPRYGISQRYIDSHRDARWVLDDVARIRDKYGGWIIEGIEPHYPPLETLSLAQGQAELAKAIRAALTGRFPCVAIGASAGIGKTHSYLEEIAKRKPGQGLVEIYVPRHELAEELQSKLRLRNPKLAVTVIRGRDRTVPGTDDLLCRRSHLVKQLHQSGSGLPVYQTLCRKEGIKCPYFDHCHYLGQFKRADDVRIYVHSHLPLPRQSQDKNIPDIAIIDESFFDTLLDIKVYNLSQLRYAHISHELKQALLESLRKGKPLFKLLGKAVGDIKEYLSTEESGLPRTGTFIDPNMEDYQIKKQLQQSRCYPMETRLLAALQAEYDHLSTLDPQNPRRQYSLTVRKNGQGKFAICQRKEIDRFSYFKNGQERQIPVLYVDADLDPSIASIFLGKLKVKTIQVERNAHIVQCYSTTNAKRRFDKNQASSDQDLESIKAHRKATNQLVKHYLKTHKGKGMLIVGYKDIMKLDLKSQKQQDSDSQSQSKVGLVYFGNLRGIDKHKDKDLCIVVGRHQLPVDALENKAAALWWDSPEPLNLPGELVPEIRGYSVRYGRRCGVRVMVHPDPRVQLVHEQTRECETLQAIDRIRATQSKHPKTIVILSNVPLPLVVDELISYQDIVRPDKIEQLLASYRKHVVPLSPEFLFEQHPELFGGVDAAKKTVSRFKQEHFHDGQGIYEKNGHRYRLFAYRIAGEKGRPKACLADATLLPKDIILELQRLHGVMKVLAT